MSDVTFVQGDTAPPINGTILKADGTVKDLTAVSSIRFQMRKADDRRYTVDAAATVVSAVAGTVTYSWGDNDLSVPGEYIAQWELTFLDGKVETTEPPNTVTVRRQ